MLEGTESGLVTGLQPPTNGAQAPAASAEVRRSRAPEPESTPEIASVPPSKTIVTTPSAS